MEYKQIQELIKLVNKSNIGELTIEQGDFAIFIKQKKENTQPFVSTSLSPQTALTGTATADAPNQSAQSVHSDASAEAENAHDDSANHLVIKSPMIGTFYRRPSPEKPLLADVGSEITVGQPVCVIEAMKLFNEIESEVAGKIIKVLVEDASPVEYDQPLFLVQP